MASIDAKIETWKNKLLDLGRRNKLLNYKDTAKSTLKITYPSYNVLFDRLVHNECTLSFPMPKSEEIDEIDELCAESESETVDNYGDYSADLRTNKKVKDLQRILRGLRNKAKIAIEEQGVNILYLCFGFLEWTEAEHSSITNRSPLILVPVTLTIESITSPYILGLHEDEITVNPTLAYKLQNDYGITLPAFDENSSLDDFYDQINETVRNQSWKVSTDVGMSLLSFLKINMYDDLNKHHDSIANNPIVRAFDGDVSGLKAISDNIADFDFDKGTKPQDVFQIVDADASQQEAILLAKKGVSFVLQGPPGTGKSQTITNIIAESLADGKKVLFVSEKLAALDVVHRRLTLAGLDDFCLVLHSHKASKRSVLDQLEKVLKLSQKKATLSDEAYRKLDNLQHDRQKLNDYADQISTVVEPLGKTIYEANGIIANLEAYSDVIFRINDIKGTTRNQYINYLHLLKQFASTIEKMTDDYKSNPWRGANSTSVNNEFRHDVNANLPGTIQALSVGIETIENGYKQIYSVFPTSIDGVSAAIRVLDPLNDSYEIPSEWILGDSELPILEEISDFSEKQNKCKAIVSEIAAGYQWLAENGVINAIESDEFFDIETQENQMEKIERVLAHGNPYYRWAENDFNEVTALFENAKEIANDINNTVAEISDQYEDGIFSIDFCGIIGRFKTEYISFTKVFKKDYRKDRKQFRLYNKEIGKKITDSDMLFVLEKLRNINEKRNWFTANEMRLNDMFGSDVASEHSDFEKVNTYLTAYTVLRKTHEQITSLHKISTELAGSEKMVREHFGFIYKGMFTDWDEAKRAWEWAVRFKAIVDREMPSRIFVEKVCSSKEYANECCKTKEQLQAANENAQQSIEWLTSFFEHPQEFYSPEMPALRDRVEACLNGLSLLEEWIDFRKARNDCIDGGLGSYITAIETENIASSDIEPIFKKRFFRLWLDAILPDYPAVLSFRRKQQDNTVAEFASLDTTQFGIARARIKSKLINDLPSLDHFTSGVDEISILKKELAKQRKIMPIRKLFKEIPNLLLTLKPCLMMSPLSVSLFLEADSYKFDIVIFDEASQVYTENAIGAIARGKQVVIAGDSKQLPPTNFFQSAVSENEFDTEDDDNDTSMFDSILDEANMLPERTLQWHYRSRHESLISFSNAKIYKNQLVTFPSNIERNNNNGVEYVYVQDGYYDRGGRKGNAIEAKKVAELVLEHFRTQPNRSLGVIAFGEVQQLAIENALREMRLQNRAFESFFDESKDEAFFVKSLENVQGDERDTIIFSIGYAPDASGVFRMNFGPLGKAGGERRLNVAITRAKYNIKLVGSILPKDINVDSITTEGPKLLRAYMDFAINGDSVLKNEITTSDIMECESPFEEAVYNFLDRKGYKLATQVGCSGYRIDIGVKHPKVSGVFVLGVECDGASYHSARTARERDRLRQDVLENMGWTIYRIWSSDWIKDPAAEGQRLIEAIEKAIVAYDDGNSTLYSETEDKDEINSFVEIEGKTAEDIDRENPYGFSEYIETSFSSVPRNGCGYVKLEDCIDEVIKNEYPVHYDILCQRVACVLGNEKATVKVRREVDCALAEMHSYKRKGDFFFPLGYTEIPIRLPNHRRVQFISTEELETAMKKIIETCVGTTRKALADETARVYGFTRSGQNITAAMHDAIENLLEKGTIEELDGKLRLKL